MSHSDLSTGMYRVFFGFVSSRCANIAAMVMEGMDGIVCIGELRTNYSSTQWQMLAAWAKISSHPKAHAYCDGGV